MPVILCTSIAISPFQLQCLECCSLTRMLTSPFKFRHVQMQVLCQLLQKFSTACIQVNSQLPCCKNQQNSVAYAALQTDVTQVEVALSQSSGNLSSDSAPQPSLQQHDASASLQCEAQQCRAVCQAVKGSLQRLLLALTDTGPISSEDRALLAALHWQQVCMGSLLTHVHACSCMPNHLKL